MPIRKINTEISDYPLVADRTTEAFYGDMEEWIVHGANITVDEQNSLKNEINNTVEDINAAVEDIATKSSSTTQNAIAANQAKNDAIAAKEAAIAAKNGAEAIYDNFDDRYLDSHATAPTVDNDGNPLRSGALYFNSTNSKMYVYDATGAKWVDMMYIPTLLSSLSDVVFGSKTNNDVLQYDSVSGKWVNRSFYTKAELDAFIDIHSKTGKNTLADTDEIAVANSVTGWSLVKITYANFKSSLKTYFDTNYTNKVATSTINALAKFGDTIGTLKNGIGAYLTDTGNMLIGTTVDNGVDKLQVNGGINVGKITQYTKVLEHTRILINHNAQSKYIQIKTNCGASQGAHIKISGLAYTPNHLHNLDCAGYADGSFTVSINIIKDLNQNGVIGTWYKSADNKLCLELVAINNYGFGGSLLNVDLQRTNYSPNGLDIVSYTLSNAQTRY